MNMCYPTPEIVSANNDPSASILPPARRSKISEMDGPTKIRRRISKSVQFDADNLHSVVGTLVHRDCLCEEERSMIWYQQYEIDEFRAEARDLCRRLRSNPSVGEVEHVRGLELRASVERQQRKHLSIRCLLRAQARLRNDPQRLAAIGRKCTAWAREVAFVEGQRDFLIAYHPNQVHSIPQIQITDAFPIPLKSKRSREDLLAESGGSLETNNEQRDVRRCKIEPVC